MHPAMNGGPSIGSRSEGFLQSRVPEQLTQKREELRKGKERMSKSEGKLLNHSLFMSDWMEEV